MASGHARSRRESVLQSARAYRWPLLAAIALSIAAATVPFALGGSYWSRPPTPFVVKAGNYAYDPDSAYPLARGCRGDWAAGASRIPIANGSPRRGPAAIAQHGLDCHASWKQDGHSDDLRQATWFADWLVRNQDRDSGAWYDGTEMTLAPGLTLEAPWPSATTQGLALSLLLRVYRATSNETYLEAARRGLEPFERPIDKGGIRTRFLRGGTWYEAYPHDPRVYALTGFMTGLLGLYDLAAADSGSRARSLLDQGMRTLERSVAYFDTGQSQLYWLYHITQKKPRRTAAAMPCGAPEAEQTTFLLAALESIDPNPWLRFFRDTWALELDQPTCLDAAHFRLRGETVPSTGPTLDRLRETKYDPLGASFVGVGCPDVALKDPNWVPTVGSGRDAYQNPGSVAETGLFCYATWALDHKKPSRRAALRFADWIIEHQDPATGAWLIPVEYDGLFRVAPNFPSGHAQGPAISLLARAYATTRDAKYRRGAVRGLRPLQTPLANGGLRVSFFGHGAWYEGYPHRPPPYAIEDFMYALIGVYDVSKVAPRSSAKTLFRTGYRTLVQALPYFDVGDTSLLWLYHITQPRPESAAWRNDCTSYDQQLLTQELAALNSIRPNPWVRFYRDRWAKELDHPACS